MGRVEIIFITGVIVAVVWLCCCYLFEDKKRKYVIITGVIIDIVLFIICKNWEMLFIGILGGGLCGLFPNLGGSRRKYEMAVRRMKGIKNWVVVSVILFVMVFLTIAVACPELKVIWG